MQHRENMGVPRRGPDFKPQYKWNSFEKLIIEKLVQFS